MRFERFRDGVLVEVVDDGQPPVEEPPSPEEQIAELTAKVVDLEARLDEPL